jgi:hypothetical protein
MEIPFTALVFVRKSPLASLERSGMAGKAEITPYAGSIHKYARVGHPRIR